MIFTLAIQFCCFLFTIGANIDNCIGQQCSEVVSIPLVDKMKATLKADIDIAELNKVLQKYIQQEVTKAVKGATFNQMEGTVNQITENVTRLLQSNVSATIDKFQGKNTCIYYQEIYPASIYIFLTFYSSPLIFYYTQELIWVALVSSFNFLQLNELNSKIDITVKSSV